MVNEVIADLIDEGALRDLGGGQFQATDKMPSIRLAAELELEAMRLRLAKQ